ncbi:MAG TPA: ABC transporter permease [Streptosporangiaceae bacterium]|jgi:ABC-2 type transport system permease protein
MSQVVVAASRLGLSRGWLEFKQTMAASQELIWTFVINGAFFLVLVLQRNSTVEGVPLALLTLPSLLGMSVATGGLMGATSILASHREDGTLLRAKAIPNGMIGYLVAQIVLTFLTTIFGMALVLVPGLFVVDGLTSVGPAGWLALIGVLVLGMLATLPWGAIIGSLVKSAASGFGLTFLPISGVVAISGIFYPITALPDWVQWIGQVFPIYWLGLGMRAAILPDAAAAAEIGGSWRHVETIGVLGAWAVVGLLIAPAVLRRMARHESGSTMEARKERALHRGY